MKMRSKKALLGTVALVIVSLFMSGCLGLFGPKVGQVGGKITYKDDGSAVAGAIVKVAGKSFTTKSDGVYLLKDIKHGVHDFTVTKDGAETFTRKVTVSKTPLTVNIQLDKTVQPVEKGTVSGTVTYETAGPVADATVAVDNSNVSVKTGADGKYTLPALEYASYTLIVTLGGKELGRKDVDVNKSAVTADITVDDPDPTAPMGVVSGVVSYESEGVIVGAEVSVDNSDVSVTTENDGSYVLPELEYGDYVLVVTLDGTELAREDVDVNAGTVTVDFVVPDPLPPTGVIKGTVMYETDGPVAGATVTVDDSSISATSDASGAYTLPALEYGDYLLIVSLDDEEMGTRTVTLDQEEKIVDFEFDDPLPPPSAFCSEVPDFAAGMTLSYCEDFSSSMDFADYEFAPTAGGEWSITEDAGKNWITGDASGWTVAYIEVDGLGTAEKVILEYTHKLTRNTHSAFLLKADSNTKNQGGNSYFSFNYSGFYALRVMADNVHGTRSYQDNSAASVVGEENVFRLIFEDGKMDVYMNDVPLGGPFPVDLGEYVYVDEENKYIGLYISNSASQWTDIRIWTE